MFVFLYALVLIACVGILNIKTSKGGNVGEGSILFAALLMSSLSPLIDYLGLHSYDRAMNAYHFSFYYTQHLAHPLSVVVDGFQEPVWALFNMLFRLFTDNYGIVLFSVAFFYAFSSLMLLKTLDGGSFQSSSTIFLCSLGPVYALSQSSQFLALSLCNIAILCLVSMNRKFFRGGFFAAFCLLASLVHTSAIVVPVLIAVSRFLVNSRLRASVFLSLGTFAAAAAVYALPFLASLIPILQQTMDSSFSGQSQGFLVALKSIPFFLIAVDALLRPRSDDVDKRGLFWAKWLLVACSGMSFVAAVGNYWFWRLAMYGLLPFASLAACDSLTSKYSRLQLLAIALQTAIALREVVILY